MKIRPGFALCALALYACIQMPFVFAPDYFNGSEGVYWQTMRLMAAGHKLYSEIFYSQWPLFIELARLGRFLPVTDLYAARLILFLFAPLALYLTFGIGERLGSRAAGLLAAAVLAVEPMFFALSHQFTGEIPALALTLLGVLLLLSSGVAFRGFLIALCFGLAIQVKVLMALPIVLSLAVWVYLDAGARAARLRLVAVIGAGVVAINILCLYAYGWFSGGGASQLQGGLVSNYSGGAQNLNPLMNLSTLWFEGGYALGFWVVVLPALVVGLAGMWRTGDKRLLKVLTMAVGVAFAVLILQSKSNPDHLVIFSPVAALAFAFYLTLHPRYVSYGMAALTTLSVAIAVTEYSWDFTRGRKRDIRAREALRAMTSPQDLVMGNHLFVITAADRLVPPEYADFSAARAFSGSLVCGDILARLDKGDIKAFVLMDRNLVGLNCEGASFADEVRKRFPREVYGDGRNFILAP